MIVGFDGSIFLTPKAGIGNYTYQLIRHLREEHSEISTRLYDGFMMREETALEGAEVQRGSSSAAAISLLRRLGPARSAWRNWKRLRFRRSASRLDLFHATNYAPPSPLDIPVLHLVHDVSYLRHPEWHPPERVRWLGGRTAELVRAPFVQTVSRFSASEIESVLGIPRSRIHVTYPGVNRVFHEESKADLNLIRDMGLSCGAYLLCVGTLEPRKNLRTVVEAYGRLSSTIRRHYPLVVVGPPGWGNIELPRMVDRLKREGQLRFLGYLDERRMRALYREATAFFYPSSYEGFGMPVSEAMATGTRPVIAAVASEEISGNLGMKLPAFDAIAWAEAMRAAIDEKWHSDALLRWRMKERVRRFDWSANARETLLLYKRLLQ
jgi:alpha-1,3-rhamnosyl/mannosyltransferase